MATRATVVAAASVAAVSGGSIGQSAYANHNGPVYCSIYVINQPFTGYGRVAYQASAQCTPHGADELYLYGWIQTRTSNSLPWDYVSGGYDDDAIHFPENYAYIAPNAGCPDGLTRYWRGRMQGDAYYGTEDLWTTYTQTKLFKCG